MMLENCCYDFFELLTLNMVRNGMFGEILHAEGAYIHDLSREYLFNKNGYADMWRLKENIGRNGNLYPTHGLGPIAQCMNINRGNRFDFLVSMSSNHRGLEEYAAAHFAEPDARRHEAYKLGDVNVTLIRTVKGQTIYVGHNTNNARPYSRLNLVQGTKGIIQGWPDRIFIEGKSPEDSWEKLDAYYDAFEHPLWKSDRVRNATAAHGGMDFLEDRPLIQGLRAGQPTD